MSNLRDRTKRFAVKLFDLIDEIPQTPKGLVVQTQLAPDDLNLGKMRSGAGHAN